MHYLAMEYVEGSDLATVVKERGPLPVQQAVECILQAARGLQYAHGKGIVHRDIKPGNLFLNNEGTVKILDMGMALIAGAEAALGGAERLTTTGQVMGTCDYMAPEQSLDTHQADARADIYSLGCTFYRLLTGSPPYQGETFAKLFLMHLESPIPSLCAVRPEVPAALDVVCQRMLAKKPEDRYQSMAEVIGELEAVLGVSSGHSTPVAPPALPESPSESVSGRWAFLQEVAPRGTLTEQKKPTATGPAQPQVGPEHDTGPKGKGKGSNSNFPAAPKGPSHPWDRSPATPLGQGRATVARVGRKRLAAIRRRRGPGRALAAGGRFELRPPPGDAGGRDRRATGQGRASGRQPRRGESSSGGCPLGLDAEPRRGQVRPCRRGRRRSVPARLREHNGHARWPGEG